MSVWFEGADGVRLAADSYGPQDGAPVILLGGLGQTRHSWSRAARRLGDGGRRAICLDIRGHGDSDRAPDGDYSFPRFVADLTAVVAALGRPAVLVGASLGGKIALATAGYGGAAVASALALVDTVPRTRPSAGLEIAQAIAGPPDGFASPDEAAGVLARRRGQDVEPGAGARLQRSLRRDDAGRWRWHWDQAIVERDHGLAMLPALDYLEQAAAKVKAPILVARGELSNVVEDAGVEAFKALAPHCRIEVIPGAGHMLVGDQNDVFSDALVRFLDGIDRT